MTIVNYASDGLYPELIVLARTVADLGPQNEDDLIRLCSVDSSTRLRGALSRWTQLGLFTAVDGGAVRLSERFALKRREGVEVLLARLPAICRELILAPENCLPLWDADDVGTSADFVRGMAWLLAQEIYEFPSAWSDGAETVEQRQITGQKTIVQNDVRWNGLRFWARFLGFATGDSASFQIDPTKAIQAELPSAFSGRKLMTAAEFVGKLGERLPVLDSGSYRNEVEAALNPESWQRPQPHHLSMSLSFALRRLELANWISLEQQADAGSALTLTGRGYRTWKQFSHVRVLEQGA